MNFRPCVAGRSLEYKLRSLNVIDNGTILNLGYGFLFAFHGNYGHITAVSTQYANVTDTQTTSQTDRGTPHDDIDRPMHGIVRQKCTISDKRTAALFSNLVAM